MKIDKWLQHRQQRATKGEVVFNALMPNSTMPALGGAGCFCLLLGLLMVK